MGKPKAYEADPLALELAAGARQGWVDKVPMPLPSFILMPLQHSENLADQESDRVCRVPRPRSAESPVYAILHRDQIKRFGRFPGRNQALGRVSTPEEREDEWGAQTF